MKAVGGENQPASSEAIKTKALGQVAKKSGYQALTNDDLKSYTGRLNLEANAKRLDYQNKPAAKSLLLVFSGILVRLQRSKQQTKLRQNR